ncbi:MAG: carbohydrate ABC transporter permease [Geminicoccaceae bacterium]
MKHAGPVTGSTAQNAVGEGRFTLARLAVATIATLMMLWPIAWMVSTSFKRPEAVFELPPRWIPEAPSLAGYEVALSAAVLRYFLNSVIVASATALLATGAGALCAYGLSRLRFRGNRAVMLALLGSLGLPIPLLMVTLYLLFFRVGILDSYLALILGHTVITLPVVVWLLKDFFDALPREFEEAAFIDGASPAQVIRLVILPLVRPGLAAAAIFVFVTSWNEFIFGMTFISSDTYRPIPAAMGLLFLNEFQYRWGDTMAVATVVTLPIMLLFVLFQRYFVSGITAGAVKG